MWTPGDFRFRRHPLQRRSGPTQSVPVSLGGRRIAPFRELPPTADRLPARSIGPVQRGDNPRSPPPFLGRLALVRVRREQPHGHHPHAAFPAPRLLGPDGAPDDRAVGGTSCDASSSNTCGHRAGPSLARRRRTMKVLCFTNIYPSARERWAGSFVRDLVEDLRELGMDVHVLAFSGREQRRAYAEAGLAFRRTI